MPSADASMRNAPFDEYRSRPITACSPRARTSVICSVLSSMGQLAAAHETCAAAAASVPARTPVPSGVHRHAAQRAWRTTGLDDLREHGIRVAIDDVGSGVIEAGCKTVIGSRLKRSGMFWTVKGANRIIALRCCRLSGKFEAFWEARSA